MRRELAAQPLLPPHALRSALLRGDSVAAASSREPWVEQLGWRPRAWLYHNFLTPEECAHLIDQARPVMERSSVVDNASGKSVDSEIRTSAGMFFRRGQDAVIKAIEDRIAAFSMVPADHGEGLQVLHYLVGQKYEGAFVALRLRLRLRLRLFVLRWPGFVADSPA